ncbi:MAG TPA: M28 family peptidase [Gemmatimonadales bacterium]|nr:M28 family peptidase [Gemmatimonadales bacterium]
MEIRGIRLHRHPAIDLSALVGALAAAFLFLRLAGAHAVHVPIPAVTVDFNADSAFLTTRILSEGFANRVTGSDGARYAATFLAAQFRTLGLQATTQDFSLVVKDRLLQGRNVVATSPGTVPGSILLVAHYDGQPTSDQSAGDDASGVATMLELARVLQRHGHRHAITYVATDAEEWGLVGAQTFAASLRDPAEVIAAISLDHVENGVGKAVRINGEGQDDDDYAPVWLRRASADAYAAGGVRTTDAGTLDELIHRVLGVSLTDQGAFIDAEVPAVDLDVESRRPEYARFLYHTPGDRWETLRPQSFALLGDGAERLVLALDAVTTIPHGPVHYLGLGDERMVRGFWILLAALALFVPLAFAAWEAWTAALADPASRTAIRSELVRAGGWWLIGIAGLLALWAAVAVDLLPEYHASPATVRDPLLYSTRWLPVLTTAVVMVLVGLLLTSLRKRAGLVVSHPLAGRVAALSTLVVVVVLTLVHNPFAAVWLLVLPAWLWPWIGPTRRPLTGAASLLIVAASAVPLVVALIVMSRPLEVGSGLLWYLFLQAAYATWSPLTTVMLVVMALAATRLLGTATARLLPAEGD